MVNIPKKRVVVTGMSCVTPVGNDLSATWHAILDGQSGAGELTRLPLRELPVHFAHEVKDFNPAAFMEEKAAKRMARFTQFAVATSTMAAAALPPGSFSPEQAGVVYTSAFGGVGIVEEQYEVMLKKGPRRVSPIALPILMINNPPSRLSIDFGLKGPNYAVASGCAGSLHAIGLAFRHIQLGEADIMFTGGSESCISILMLAGLAKMGVLSTRNWDPTGASRPFDRDRDGFVLGEGAGTLILEELEHARARKAPILAEVLGYGFTGGAERISDPDESGDGIVRAMLTALDDSKLLPEEVDYVNAEGASTRAGDRAEAEALKRVFGAVPGGVAVSSTKGHTGHLLGAAGAVETILSIMAVNQGIIPPTINFRTPDPECDIDVNPNRPKRKDIRRALVNNFGFGGHNATLCLGEYVDSGC